MSYFVFFLIRTYILYSQLARCCVCFLFFFWRRMQWFPPFFLFQKKNLYPILYIMFFIIHTSFFQGKQKMLFLCKINLSIDMLIIFHVRTYSIVLSVCIFVLDFFFTGTVFSRRKKILSIWCCYCELSVLSFFCVICFFFFCFGFCLSLSRACIVAYRQEERKKW